MASYRLIAYRDGKEVESNKMDSDLDYVRKYAYHLILRASWPVDYVEIADMNDRSIGVVLFDHSKVGYRGLGAVYVPYLNDQAYHLTPSGRISRFTDVKDIRYAKNLRNKLWAGYPIWVSKNR